MCTSVIVIALSGFFGPGAETIDPKWLSDYTAARQRGREEEKPLAIFVGTGKAGWEEVIREGHLSMDARRLLMDRYICLYVNTEEREGRELADALDIRGRHGVVISSASCQLQAFWHEGELHSDDLDRCLRRYSDPNRIVDTTETVQGEALAYHRPEAHKHQAGLFEDTGCWKEEVLESHEPVLVDFYGTWCPPCRAMQPTVDAIARDYKVFKVNVDMNRQLAASYGISTIPTLLIIKDGQEVTRHVGITAEARLRSALDNAESH